MTMSPRSGPSQAAAVDSDALFAAGSEIARTMIPAAAKGLIVAERREDRSDPHADYHGHSVAERVVIGVSLHARNVFDEFRAHVGRLPEMATVRDWHEHRETYAGGGGMYLAEGGGFGGDHGWVIRKETPWSGMWNRSTIESLAIRHALRPEDAALRPADAGKPAKPGLLLDAPVARLLDKVWLADRLEHGAHPDGGPGTRVDTPIVRLIRHAAKRDKRSVQDVVPAVAMLVAAGATGDADGGADGPALRMALDAWRKHNNGMWLAVVRDLVTASAKPTPAMLASVIVSGVMPKTAGTAATYGVPTTTSTQGTIDQAGVAWWRLFAAAGVSPDAPGMAERGGPLHAAIRQRLPETVRTLIADGVDPHGTDGHAPWNDACAMLANRQPNPGAVLHRGGSPLEQVILALRDAGAVPDIDPPPMPRKTGAPRGPMPYLIRHGDARVRCSAALWSGDDAVLHATVLGMDAVDRAWAADAAARRPGAPWTMRLLAALGSTS